MLAKSPLTVSSAFISFSFLVSIRKTILLILVSIWSFFARLYISTSSRLSNNRFLMKLSLSYLSLYATRRFCIWNAASLPTIYTSSLSPFARMTYSNWCSSNTLKNWYPCKTWLSAGESTKAITASSYSSILFIVVARALPSVSIIHISILVIFFNPSIVV